MDHSTPQTTFEQLLSEGNARLVIKHQKTEEGKDNFEWGIAGQMPLISLIGQLTKAQQNLCIIPECPEQALAIIWDGSDWHQFIGLEIPEVEMTGMIELVKASLIGSHAAQQSLAQSTILGPGGKPVRTPFRRGLPPQQGGPA